jgi:hypothetical protein
MHCGRGRRAASNRDRGATRAVTAGGASRSPWAVVTNKLGPGGETTRAELQELLGGRPIAIELPCCPALRDAEDDARLLASDRHRWRRAVKRLAAALASP